MAVVFPYVKQTWTDGVHSCDAARNNVHEDGIYNAHNKPAVRVYHSANQSINNVTETALAFNSEAFDQAGGAASTMHDTVTANSRLTCRYAGIYWIAGNVAWAGNATGYRRIHLYLNGTTVLAYDTVASVHATEDTWQSVSTLYALAVSDYVELRVWQSSGGALNANAYAPIAPAFSMVRVA